MLRKPFHQAQEDIAEYLSHRDYQTGQTWYDFCRQRGFTYTEMLSGLDWKEAWERSKRERSSTQATPRLE